MSEIKNSEVDQILSEQRDESDARSIINEIERINTLEGKFQYRWIWELIQNARDEAGEGVDIKLDLQQDKFTFTHNGKPFTSHNLLALIRKTSTKPITGANGNTGKFGTGFVTSHLLSKIVTIDGVHKNTTGNRRFALKLTRTAIDLEAMKESISVGIQKVRDIDILPSENSIERNNQFLYELKESTYQIALGGINQLRENLAFTLLVNPQIKSIDICIGTHLESYSSKIQPTLSEKIKFVQLIEKNNPSTFKGLLFYKNENLIIASPVLYVDEKFSLLTISPQSRLYKDLPLIGTEDFYIPIIFQHSNFYPTEPRDGVRTRKSADINEDDDHIAKTNRNAFAEFVNLFPEYLKVLIELDVNDLHLLSESGVPLNADQYYDSVWYLENVQMPIRRTLIERELVKTVSGKNISVLNGKFPKCNEEYADDLHSLLSKWYPDNCPDANSYKDWIRIIAQETENWPVGITVTIEDLVKEVADKKAINAFGIEIDEAICFLQELIQYLEKTGEERLGHDNEIYPNQNGGLSSQSNVFHDSDLDSRFKIVSKGMGRLLESELLPKNFKAKYIEPFDVKGFLIELNTEIGNLKVETAQEEQIEAIINLCCSFKAKRAERREQWYELLNHLLPEKAKEKVIVNLTQEYQWEPAEKSALKYVCFLIQSSVKLEEFANTYFSGDVQGTIGWLDGLYEYIFRSEENQSAASTYAIIPTQDGLFKKYTDEIFKEDGSDLFTESMKELYSKYSKKGDARQFLVVNGIKCKEIRSTSFHKLSIPIDDLFKGRDSEDKVLEEGEYHDLFLKLKEWSDPKKNDVASDYFPIFTEKHPVLYVKAFGGSNFSRLLKITNSKSVDEIEQLASLQLTPSQLLRIDQAVTELGSADQLLQKAYEMIEQANLVRWRQTVGKAAEDAFVEAIGEAESQFLNPENPDDGKDFVIKMNGKEYSIELKSAVEGKETVSMSLKQGKSAVEEKDHYSLCVISRPSGQLTNKDQFISNAKFVINIGDHIGDKIHKWEDRIQLLNSEENVSVDLESSSGSVNVRKPLWASGISFPEFVVHLKKYFEIS